MIDRAPKTALLVAGGVALALAPLARAADFTWTGAGSDNNWTNPDNWTLTSGTDAGANGYPDGTTDLANLRNTAPNTISLDQSLSIGKLDADSSISTDYTISGPGTLSVYDSYGVRNRSSQTLTLDVPLDITNSANNFTTYGAARTVFNGAIIGSGTPIYRNGGTYEFNAANTYNGNTYLSDGSDAVVGNAQAFSNNGFLVLNDDNSTISLNSDVTVHESLSNRAAGSEIRVLSGDSDRVFEVNSDVAQTAAGNSLALGDNANGDDGQVILHQNSTHTTVSYNAATSTVAGSTVKFSASGATQTINWEDAGVISGDGRVVKTGDGKLVLSTNAAQTYTGGTRIEAGTLSVKNGESNLLPQTGTILVADGAILNLSNVATTEDVGGLAGDGTVDLDTSTLHIAEQLTPGESGIGTLAVNSTGTLALADSQTSIFELDSTASPGDQVTFDAAADLTLDGDLQIEDAGGLETGSYTLFDFLGDDGTTTGSYDNVILSNGFSGNVSVTSGGDVVLNVVPEPATLGLLVLGGLTLLGRRPAPQREG